VSDELLLAVIHGTLHLLGYDHNNAEKQDEMWEAQAEALEEFGVTITVPRFEFPDADEGE
jgi:rRNA maturation RNase YbeY